MTAARAVAPRVSVVVIDLDDASVGDLERRVLSPDERARAERYLDPTVARRFVAAHIALRRELGRLTDQTPETLRFAYAEHGKPRLVGGRIEFNLAHSAHVALLASCVGRRLGVDIEWMERVVDRGAVMRRAFSPFERARLEALPLDEQRRAFFEAWTRKEAWAKAVGTGLTTDFARVEVSFGIDVEPSIIAVDGDRQAGRRWQVTSLEPRAGFVAAVVVDRNERTPSSVDA